MLIQDMLFPELTAEKVIQPASFSAGNFGNQGARKALEEKFLSITQVTDDFNRKLVSHQLSKNDCLHRWLKYREGFSAELVMRLFDEFKLKKGDTVLDPFLGSGTTALVAKLQGLNAIGYDILPMTAIAVNAKQAVFDYKTQELSDLISELERITMPANYSNRTPSLNITEGAYSDETQREIAFYTEWNAASAYSSMAKNLVTLCLLNSLEKVSFTAKDGQYLRWDFRSSKLQQSAIKRKENGRPPLVARLDKGNLPSLKNVLLNELKSVAHDITLIQNTSKPSADASIKVISGSALFELQELASETVNAVVTSPPYCNRYDYTRTYALELAYLNTSEDGLKNLRQELLSCTVENKSKLERLREHYEKLGRKKDFERIHSIILDNEPLNEIREVLSRRYDSGDINNKGVLRMVNEYFTELTFIYAELFRVSKQGAKIAFVNDNVRYGGEVIPVDFISTELATQIGFKPVKIYSLKQQKGNSSQQMKKFGRIPLRKSITIWEKP